MSKRWDHFMKIWAKANPQDFVSWLLKEGVFLSEANVEIKTDSRFADLMFAVQWRGQNMILHVEFQREHDPTMNERVWIYNISTCIHSHLPVLSIVIYLVKDAPIQEPIYEVKLPSGTIIHQFCFENIKLWEIPPEAILQQNLPGLLPLLPLTKGGQQRAVVEQMINEMQKQTDSKNLLTLGLEIAGLVFTPEGPDGIWLRERYRKMQPMLEGSWIFKDIKQQGVLEGFQDGFEQGQQQGLERGQQQGLERGQQQGLEQGKQEGLQQGKQEGRLEGEIQALLAFIAIQFPPLLSTARQVTQQLHAVERIQALRDQLYRAKTLEEAHNALVKG